MKIRERGGRCCKSERDVVFILRRHGRLLRGSRAIGVLLRLLVAVTLLVTAAIVAVTTVALLVATAVVAVAAIALLVAATVAVVVAGLALVAAAALRGSVTTGMSK